MTAKLQLKPYHKLNEVCPDCGEYTDVTMVEVQGLYDGALYWQCLHCPTAWHRFPNGHWLNKRAQDYADGKFI